MNETVVIPAQPDEPVAGLGPAVAVFGDAGILRDKPVTCQAWEIERLVKAGARVDRSRSVVEACEGRLGPILSSRDPASARELARRLVRILSER
jgi:putative intracellular protease/amidase